MMRHTPPTWLIAAILVASGGAPSVAEEVADKEAFRAQLEQTRRDAADAARRFLDNTSSDETRLDAVADVDAFLDEASVTAAYSIIRDDGESPRVRAAALLRVQPFLDQDNAIIDDLLGYLRSGDTPEPFRRTVARVLQAVMFSSFSMHAKHTEYFSVLRDLLRDDDEALRLQAFETLIAYGDDQAEQLLLRGLASPDAALLSPEQSLQVLGLNLQGDALPVIDTVLQDPPSEEARLLAIRLLGTYEPSRSRLISILNDADDSDEARLASLQALNAGAPGEFASIAVTIVRDEQVSDDIRTYAIQAELLRRLADRGRLKRLDRPTDEFDAAVRKLLESESVAVRDTSRRYVNALLPNNG